MLKYQSTCHELLGVTVLVNCIPIGRGRVNRVCHHKGSSILGVAAEAAIGGEPPQHRVGVNGGLKGTPALRGPMAKAEVWGQPAQVVDLGIHLPVLQHAFDGTVCTQGLEADV